MMNSFKLSKSEFKANAFEFFRQVEESGQSIVITDRGKPIVEIRAYLNDKRSPLHILRGSVLRYDNPIEPIDVEGRHSI
jgi:antitoxin (DNA-binding transcriptional repressor) of toxin-antitoxin stability system